MYFGAIAVVVAADVSTGARILLLGVFNLAYVAPLIAITVTVAALGHRADPALRQARTRVERSSHLLLAALTAASGVYLIVIGIQGLR
jgi:cytochrome c biogenesis protein CcdA